MLDSNIKIYVAGHRGLVGSAIVRNLQEKGYGNIVAQTHAELDLTDQLATEAFFRARAARVRFPRGGQGRRYSSQ